MYLLVIFIITLIIPLIVMPRGMRSGLMSPMRNVFSAALSVSVAAAVVLMVYFLAGNGMFAHIQEIIKVVAKEVAANPVWDSFPGLEKLDESDRAALLSQVYEGLALRMPAYVMTAAAVVAYIEYIIISNMPWNRGKVAEMPGFREFSLPPAAFSGIFLMYFAAWGISMTDSLFGTAVYANVNYLFDFAFILQGISVVFMFAHIRRIPKAVAVIVVILAFSNNICMMLLVLIGMFDLIIGLKKKISARAVKK